jgi:hypothetical protein
MASRVRVTDRDLAVLSFAVDQFAIPMVMVAELVRRGGSTATTAVAEAVARRLAARLEAGHYVRRVRVAGEVWMVPTGRGIALGMPDGDDRPYDLWQPVKWKLEHISTVARLRLALVDAFPGSTWESERAIRRRWHNTGARVRHADGGLHLPSGAAAGIEVELNTKRQSLYDGIVGDTDPTWTAGVWWFAPAGHVETLRRRLASAAQGLDHQVHELPEGVRA